QFHHRQITECDQQVEAELANFPNRAGEKTHTVKPRKRGRKSNDVRFEATGPLFKALGVDLTLIEGIDVGTALVILAEIGVDVSRFPTEKHFASWLRLCPPQDESNKTKKRRGHRKATNRVTIALRMCAQSIGQTMTPMGLFYRRIRSRIGALGAVKATAHKFACLVYRMLKYGQEYVTQSMEEYEAKVKVNILKSLKRKAAALASNSVRCPRSRRVDRGGRHRATGLWSCTTLRNQILRHRFAILGVRGDFRRRPTLEPETASAQSPHTTHQAREFMGRAFENAYHSMPFACASGL